MNSPDNPFAAMCQAHASGDADAVRRLLDAHPELEEADRHLTWLHRAAEAGQPGVIDFWLARGWDVNRNVHKSKADGEKTPLHYAKDGPTARHLLARGARVNAWARYGGTPLHCAVIRAVEPRQRGRRREGPDTLADPIRVLLEAGADPALADFDGLTPLALAVQLRRTTAEKALREAGAPEKGRRPPRQPTRAPAIDLRKEARRIATALAKAVKRFAREHPDLPVTGVYLAVSGIEGYAMVAFDTGGADNPWDASHSEYASVAFQKWRDAYELSSTGVRLTEVDGTAVHWPEPVGDVEFERPFFRAAVAVLEQAHAEGCSGRSPGRPGFDSAWRRRRAKTAGCGSRAVARRRRFEAREGPMMTLPRRSRHHWGPHGPPLARPTMLRDVLPPFGG
jgi:hypothetical protein